MKNYLILCVSLILLFSCAESHNPKKTNHSKDTTPIPSTERTVDNNVILSNHLPEISIKVQDEFKYVGKFDFEIIASSDEYAEDIQGKTVAVGERLVFVASDEKKAVEKLFIVQFEGFLPHLDFTYNYNFSQADSIGNNRYRHNTWFYNSKKLAEENPNNEGTKTRAFLTQKGFQLEDEFMMSRFVGLASEDRKNEIIIYYLEMLPKTTGYSLEEYENSISEEEQKSIRNALVERSKKSFSIL